ncbi:MAG TPA: hypothetical protein DCY13_05290, partial [Verrucomicrobiales bacterium]|nr:hypothetical protein [Verrucomicrobiales bacterium]
TGAEEIKRDNGPAVAAAEKAAAPAVAKKNSCSECCPDRCYSGEVESKTAVLTTGTHIPEKAKANDQITDSARNVRVIDRKAVERTGAANLTEALRVLTR